MAGRRGAQHYMVDQQHVIRFASGNDNVTNEPTASYFGGDKKWHNAYNLDWYKKGFYPVAFTEDPLKAIVKGPTKYGTRGFFYMNLDTGEVLKEIFAHEKVDASHLVYASQTAESPENLQTAGGKPVAVAYYDGGFKLHYFSKYHAKLQAFVDRTLPETSNYIVSQSKAAKRYIIKTYSDTDAGVFYMLDMKAKALNPLGEAMPGMMPSQMSHMTNITIKARDDFDIPSLLTIPKDTDDKKLPMVIMVHGGPPAHYVNRFNAQVQLLASRGYAVLQPNFRGSTGFGRKHRSRGRHQWGGTMQDDVTDATRWAIDEGIADPDRICIVGGSYGGYAALMGVIKQQGLYKCAVSVNGVANLLDMKATDTYNNTIGGSYWAKSMALEGVNDKEVSPYHQASKISAPILLVAAEDDQRVPTRQSRQMHDRLRKLGKLSKYIELDEGGHGLDTASSETAYFKALIRFLDQQLADE